MNFESVAFFFLVFEIVSLACLFTALTYGSVYSSIHSSKSSATKTLISSQIVDSIINQKSFVLPFKFHTINNLSLLLDVLENFDCKFKGGKWEPLKREIYEKFLLKKARAFAKSRDWVKRNFAARCFSLCPSQDNLSLILLLMDDPVFLVRGVVSNTVVKMESKEGIFKILEKMSAEQGYSYWYYRDILLSSSNRVFEWIEEYSLDNSKTSFHLACLDVLEHPYFHLKKLNLEKEIRSSNPEIHLAALKILSHNPQVEAFKYISDDLEDNNLEIQTEAIKALEYCCYPDYLKKLENKLKDPSWTVRLNSAMTLLKNGEKGTKILSNQKLTANTNAYEVSQFALKYYWNFV